MNNVFNADIPGQRLQRFVFNKTWLGSTCGISERDMWVMNGVQIEDYISHQARMLIIGITKPILESDVIEDVQETEVEITEVPRNWWHGILDRFVPRRMKKTRARIGYREIKTMSKVVRKYSNICPHFSGDGDHVSFLGADPQKTYLESVNAEYFVWFPDQVSGGEIHHVPNKKIGCDVVDNHGSGMILRKIYEKKGER